MSRSPIHYTPKNADRAQHARFARFDQHASFGIVKVARRDFHRAEFVVAAMVGSHIGGLFSRAQQQSQQLALFFEELSLFFHKGGQLSVQVFE